MNWASLAIFLLIITQAQGLSVCPSRVITSDGGEVTSPGYPSNYPPNTDCTLTIATGPGAKFNVMFNDLSIEVDPDAPEECKMDSLVITDGSKTRKYCEENVPAYDLPRHNFKSEGNTLVMRFKSENAFQFKGFKITFKAEKGKVIPPESNVCPSRHIKYTMGGEFFSPGFPVAYPANSRCRVKITIPDNYQMNVWLTDFQIHETPSCRSDRLIVKDDLGGYLLCGGGRNHRVPKIRPLTSTTSKIQFYSDSKDSAPGFHLHYNMTRLTKGSCQCTVGSSFIMITRFSGKVNRTRHVITLSLKTAQSRGLIFFAKGELRDYIYIGIKYGKVFYDSDLGTGRSKVYAEGIRVDDGEWHSVVITREKKTLAISVDNGRAKGQTDTRGDFNKIDLPNSVGLILGVPSTVKGLVPNFIGCIRDFSVDGIEPLTNAYAGKTEYRVNGPKMTECLN
ncbi:neuropilin-2 [Nematostella vectensis]|uniref:neuropilin-2 n=1 Tax=Nematostella vectensis TaxID=45351 RepID=UPI002076E729|nr:neuropilin-2 [Nematostella vectensis]XP_048587668.1 neuropilin-2 [Nematostella vectensis]